MVKDKEKNITVIANDQNHKVKLENPNLKIISKHGEQISVHNFFELFTTVERTKNIKKQLDKEISILKKIKVSFQKKLKKFKEAKLFSIRKLKDQETFLQRHYEEIISKMREKAQQEIVKHFAEYKKEITEEKENTIAEILKAKESVLMELDDTGTSRENFKKFTKISQDYIRNTLSSTLSEIESAKTSLSLDIEKISQNAKKEISEIKQSSKKQSSEIEAGLDELKATLQTEVLALKKSSEEEMKTISKQIKTENAESLQSISSNIEDFNNQTKEKIKSLTTKFETEQDTMLKNTYKDLQRLQIKLQETDKTEDIKAINDDFKELKKQNELALKDLKINTNQNLSENINEVINKIESIKSSNKEEFDLIKSQISEHEQMFYEKVQSQLNELLDASQLESKKQIQINTQIIETLKLKNETELEQIKQEIHNEKIQMIESAMNDLNKLKAEVHEKAEEQLIEATGLLKDFKQSFEKSQKELLLQNKDQLLALEQNANLKIQEHLSSVKSYIEEFKKDSINNIHDITRDVENEQKVLNRLIIQIKEIKTTLETGVFSDLESTIKNIESVKQNYELQIENLKKENKKTQQETIRQLKYMVEDTINIHVKEALNKLSSLQEQLKTEKNQITESAIKLNKLQSQTQQELYEQLEQTLVNVNSIKEEAQSSIKQLKNESFTEIINIKKSLHQVIGYLKKQKAPSEKKILNPSTVITKKEAQSQDDLVNLLIKEGINL